MIMTTLTEAKPETPPSTQVALEEQCLELQEDLSLNLEIVEQFATAQVAASWLAYVAVKNNSEGSIIQRWRGRREAKKDYKATKKNMEQLVGSIISGMSYVEDCADRLGIIPATNGEEAGAVEAATEQEPPSEQPPCQEQ